LRAAGFIPAVFSPAGLPNDGFRSSVKFMNADAVHHFNGSARPDITEISDDEHVY
jgi:hypothetical protein